LSAKSLSENVIKALSGGNDYLKNPFSMDELMVIIRSLLYLFLPNSSATPEQTKFEFCGCMLDTMNQQLKTTTNTYDISYKEAALLKMLLIEKMP